MATSSFEVHVRTVAATPLIDLQGEINAEAGPGMSGAYEDAAGGDPSTIVLNFLAVSYINSTGIAHIVGLLAKARQKGIEVRAFGLSDHYKEIFAVTRVSDFMRIFSDETNALQDIPSA